MQQQYAAPYRQTIYYNPSPQGEIPEEVFHHMQTVQVKSQQTGRQQAYLTTVVVNTT